MIFLEVITKEPVGVDLLKSGSVTLVLLAVIIVLWKISQANSKKIEERLTNTENKYDELNERFFKYVNEENKMLQETILENSKIISEVNQSNKKSQQLTQCLIDKMQTIKESDFYKRLNEKQP